MSSRKAVTALLLAFVAVSLGYMVLRGDRPAQASSGAATARSAPAVSPGTPQEQGTKVIAYYFHVTVRCVTCRAIEAYSKAVIHQKFAKDLADGRLEWRPVNVQLPENRHYIQDYQLFTRSLVLALIKDGQQKEFKVLNDTWELVRTPELMQGYVEKEVRGYLRKL
jgi:hypothetical protein